MSKTKTDDRVFVVLGMHRGGTSASARALRSLGVDSGPDLLAPIADQNPKGFFEDEPLLRISERVLETLNMAWDSPRIISSSEWENPLFSELELEAVQSIRDRFGDIANWGFKNPRTSRLVPFWQRVFERAHRDASYLIVLRNPISVSLSLQSRNGLSSSRAHLLWLLHMTEAVIHTKGRRRVCVDYDRLILAPRDEVDRVAEGLGLPCPSDDCPDFREFVDAFLTPDLRNSKFEASDLDLDPHLSGLAVEAYGLLARWSQGDPDLDEAMLQAGFERIQDQIGKFEPVLADLAVTETANRSALAALEESRALSEARSQELLRTQRRLGDERLTLEVTRGQLDGLTQTSRDQSNEIEDLRTRLIRQQAIHQEQLKSSERYLRAQVWEHEGRLEQAHSRAETFERENQSLILELESERKARITEVQHLEEVRAVEAERTRTWLREQSIRLTADLNAGIDSLAESRQWRWTRSMQRGFSRIRGRAWVDGMAQLQSLARVFHAESQRTRPDARFLSALASDVRRTLQDLTSGEIFKLSRALSATRHALRLSRRPDGPFEFVRARVGELQFHFENLSSAPIGSVDSAIDETEKSGTVVDVVIPVYKARADTLRCIQSVLDADCRTPFELIVIDDASHDAKLTRKLASWASEGVLTLLRNERNLGFPATANRGMTLHSDRDVILLNSDTMVHGDWIDRLRRSAHGDWRVATATPFSNNAEICSYPAFCRAGEMPTREELAELDVSAARANRSLGATIPTAVGFCMYIRREALREVGLFDADRFGRGYGEENDFCMRARARGYRHVLAADVFVAHAGAASFSETKTALIAEGLAELDRLHPTYQAEIQSFLGQDPVRWLRQRIDIQRLAPADRPGILMVSHAMGGGTHRHVLEIAAHLEKEAVSVFLLQPSMPGVVKLTRPGAPDMPNLEFRLPEDFDALVEALRQSGIRHVHIQHLLGVDRSAVDLASALGCEYDATLHDYTAICPRVHVMDERGRYCGLPEVKECTACVKRNGSDAGFEVDVEQWRADHERWLAGARRVFVPSEDARARLASIMPSIDFKVRVHPEDYSDTRNLSVSAKKASRNRRVAVIGAIGPHKGSEFLYDCAVDAAKRNLPLEFHLIGYSDRDQDLLETKKVEITGHYEEAELEKLLQRARCELAFIPSVWPETFCYTLSAAFRWQILPVAFDLGAVRERIEAQGFGELVSLDSTPQEVNDLLLALESKTFPSSMALREAHREAHREGETASHVLGVRYRDYLREYYDGLELGSVEVPRQSS